MPFPKKKASADSDTKKSAAKKAKKKVGVPLFKAPADFKPAFYEVEFDTLKDGFIRGGTFTVNRVKGRWDNPDAKRYDLAEFDPGTLAGIAARMSCAIFATNVTKRLLPKTRFTVVIRVTKKAADDSLVTKVKGCGYMSVSAKTGKPKMKWLSKDSPADDVLMYRKLRKFSKFGPGAFVECQLPPSGRQKKSKKDDEE